MIPKTTVLVAVDLAQLSEPAVSAAGAYAGTPRCAVHLVHVVSPLVDSTPVSTIPASMGPTLLDRVLDFSTKQMEDLRRTAFGGIADVTVHVSVGRPGADIVDLARGVDADVVIVGTRGRTGVVRALLGSVAEYVVRHAPCPVLVARERPSSPVELETKPSVDVSAHR